ncbi:hypothetical protein [Yersinia kristensenii]|uniref:Uncharacterized protein n=1 Tax=Yersinia kristensenii TaxID=28152 RepID=A0AB73QDZ5_YERKR|nr:hypothetical protein [Yersinia kristensenii]OVZ82199.1 hypothetical protein CBW52_05150 [Yersinia kristensenii]
MLDFFKELFAAMRTTAVERIKSPVIGALCFSWLVFNWDNILTILFSTATIEVKIGMVKANSTILTTMVWPILSTALITILLPIISAKVISIQNKPTKASMNGYAERTNAALDIRIISEHKRARADIAYDREKTGEEEKIQKMREDIEISKEKTGEITKEKDELIAEKKALISEKNNLIAEKNELIAEKQIMLEINNKLSQDMIELTSQLDETRTKLRMANRNDDLNKVTLGMPSTMQHQDKE